MFGVYFLKGVRVVSVWYRNEGLKITPLDLD